MESTLNGKTLVLEDRKTVEETYKFLKALLEDYSSCKTTLARAGIIKSLEMLLNKIGEAHARTVDAKIALERELEAIKAKLPKSKEEIKKILHEAGFRELEEVEGGPGFGNVPSPDLTPKQYAELYRRLYGESTKADERKLDRDTKKIEEVEENAIVARTKASDEILEEAVKDPDDSLGPKKEMTVKEVFRLDDSNKDGDSEQAFKKSKKVAASSNKKKKSSFSSSAAPKAKKSKKS